MATLDRLTLDPRSIPAGRLGGWTFTAVLMLVAVGGVLPALLATGAPWVSWLGTGVLALWVFGGLGFLAHAGPAIRYRTTWLRVDDDGLEYEHGWLWRHRISVPRSRVQHTDVTQGPYARRFGLGTLVVYTAGTEHASISIEGLRYETAIALRDALLARHPEPAPSADRPPAGDDDAV